MLCSALSNYMLLFFVGGEVLVDVVFVVDFELKKEKKRLCPINKGGKYQFG